MTFKMLWFWIRHPKTALRLRRTMRVYRTQLNPFEPRGWPRHVRRSLWRAAWAHQWRRKVENNV